MKIAEFASVFPSCNPNQKCERLAHDVDTGVGGNHRRPVGVTLTVWEISPAERRLATKKILLVYTMLLLAGAAGVAAAPKPVRLVLSPASTVPRADIMKHIVDKCPNVSFVLDSRKSDFMLEAWGWSGSYKFTVFQKGGQAVYSTSTVLLSNAVKDVCKFVNSQSARDAE